MNLALGKGEVANYAQECLCSVMYGADSSRYEVANAIRSCAQNAIIMGGVSDDFLAKKGLVTVKESVMNQDFSNDSPKVLLMAAARVDGDGEHLDPVPALVKDRVNAFNEQGEVPAWWSNFPPAEGVFSRESMVSVFLDFANQSDDGASKGSAGANFLPLQSYLGSMNKLKISQSGKEDGKNGRLIWDAENFGEIVLGKIKGIDGACQLALSRRNGLESAILDCKVVDGKISVALFYPEGLEDNYAAIVKFKLSQVLGGVEGLKFHSVPMKMDSGAGMFGSNLAEMIRKDAPFYESFHQLTDSELSEVKSMPFDSILSHHKQLKAENVKENQYDSGWAASGLSEKAGGGEIFKPFLGSNVSLNKNTTIDLTREERKAIHDYSGSSYRDLNKNLRDGNALDAQQKIIDDNLQKVFQKQSRIDVVKTFRGSRGGSMYREEGVVHSTLQYLSTSRSVEQAENFYHWGSSKNYQAVVFGRSGLDISSMSQIPSEKEVLYNRNTKFETIFSAFYEKDNVHKTVVEEVGTRSEEGRRKTANNLSALDLAGGDQRWLKKL